jgi:hypothetical protein
MERCTICNQDILMSHPLDRCFRCGEPTCPECVYTDIVVCKICMTSKTPTPRVPTAREKHRLAELLVSRSYDADEAKRLVEEHAYIAVFDTYTTTSPGYSGKVMFVLWNDKPSHYELLTFGDDNYSPIVLQEVE